jgi:poly-gamma-glutamate synthesis protein (capsule biosynthesis protein)
MITIVIGADICPIGNNQPYFIQPDAGRLFNDLLPEFEQADLVLANLECPLIERPSPIPKTGPSFGEPSACINAIKQAGIDVLALANNHILDHGAAGLQNTIEVCTKAGIATVGAGENLEAARRILIKKAGGLRVGILAMAEHEFSIATENSWGANPLDLIAFVRSVNRHRGNFDYLLVLLHGGDEFMVPSPRLKETCHFLIEMGAGAVIVQHPHCLGGYEEYQGGHIVYGQGALVMDEALYRRRKSFHEGFLVKLQVPGPGGSRLELIPFDQSGSAPGARKMAPEAGREFLQKLAEHARAISDDAFVRAEWLKFCQEHKHNYISSLLGHNRILRRLNARGKLLKLLHSDRILLGTRNIVCCETHREVIETIFQQRML